LQKRNFAGANEAGGMFMVGSFAFPLEPGLEHPLLLDVLQASLQSIDLQGLLGYRKSALWRALSGNIGHKRPRAPRIRRKLP
jgi:hypothetical protein